MELVIDNVRFYKISKRGNDEYEISEEYRDVVEEDGECYLVGRILPGNAIVGYFMEEIDNYVLKETISEEFSVDLCVSDIMACIYDKTDINFRSLALRKRGYCDDIFDYSKLDVLKIGLKSLKNGAHNPNDDVDLEEKIAKVLAPKYFCGCITQKGKQCKNSVSQQGVNCFLHGGVSQSYEKNKNSPSLSQRIKAIRRKDIQKYPLYNEFKLDKGIKIFSRDFSFLKGTFGPSVPNFCNAILRREVARKFAVVPTYKDMYDSELSAKYQNMEIQTEDILDEIWRISHGIYEPTSDPPKNYEEFKSMIGELRSDDFSWLPKGECVFIEGHSVTDVNTQVRVSSSNPTLFMVGTTLVMYRWAKNLKGKDTTCTILAYASVSLENDKYPYIDSCVVVNFCDGTAYTMDLECFTREDRISYIKKFIGIDSGFKMFEKSFDCPICSEEDTSLKPMSCGHWICDTCRKKVDNCPFCRRSK
jgi:hypothetical protein